MSAGHALLPLGLGIEEGMANDLELASVRHMCTLKQPALCRLRLSDRCRWASEAGILTLKTIHLFLFILDFRNILGMEDFDKLHNMFITT